MTYRSPEDALRERSAALEEELDRLVDARKSACELEAEIARVADALAKSRTLLDRLEKKRALPMLEQVRVASPCNARWDTMVGDEKVRYCGACKKNVFNLSAMSREEAEMLMLERDGELCIRLYRRSDGTVLTRDCPVGVQRRRLRLVGVVALGGAVLAAGAGFAAALVSEGDPCELPAAPKPPGPPPSGHTMGESGFESEHPEPPPPPPPPEVEMGKRAAPPAKGPAPR